MEALLCMAVGREMGVELLKRCARRRGFVQAQAQVQEWSRSAQVFPVSACLGGVAVHDGGNDAVAVVAVHDGGNDAVAVVAVHDGGSDVVAVNACACGGDEEVGEECKG